MYSQQFNTIVLDTGSLQSKAGLAGQYLPRSITPSFAAIQPAIECEPPIAKQTYFGETSLSDNPQSQIEQILFRGRILHYDLYESLLSHIFNHEIRYTPEEYSIIISEDISTNKEQREKICRLLFEKFAFKNVFFSKKYVLSCYASGRATGLVVDSGAESTNVVPVHDGYALIKNYKTSPYGGESLSRELEHYIEHQLKIEIPVGIQSASESFRRYHKNGIVRQIKEEIYKTSSMQTQSVQYTLPDNTTIEVNKKHVKQPLFYPSLPTDSAYSSLHHLANESVTSCEQQIRKELFSNIILTGGNSLIENLSDQFTNKLSELNLAYKAKLLPFQSSAERKYLGWMGGSILGSLSSFQSFYITKQEWTQSGIGLVEKKCP